MEKLYRAKQRTNTHAQSQTYADTHTIKSSVCCEFCSKLHMAVQFCAVRFAIKTKTAHFSILCCKILSMFALWFSHFPLAWSFVRSPKAAYNIDIYCLRSNHSRRYRSGAINRMRFPKQKNRAEMFVSKWKYPPQMEKREYMQTNTYTHIRNNCIWACEREQFKDKIRDCYSFIGNDCVCVLYTIYLYMANVLAVVLFSWDLINNYAEYIDRV